MPSTAYAWGMAHEQVHNRVYELRAARGTTQEELAQAAGVSRQTIVAIERGNYSPSVLLALKLAAYFKAPVERVFYIRHEK